MHYTIGMLDSSRSKDSESFVVKTKQFNYIIDTGYANAQKDVLQLYRSIPTQKNNDQLDILIISHGDDDHCRGLAAVVKVLKPEMLIYSPLQHLRIMAFDEILNSSLPLGHKEEMEKKRSPIARWIRENKNEYVFFRVRNNSDRNLNREYDREPLQFDGVEIEEFGVEQENSTFSDIILMIRKGRYVTENFSVTAIVNRLTVEFETYETGHAKQMEQLLEEFIRDLRSKRHLPHELIDLFEKHKFLKLDEAQNIAPRILDKYEFMNLVRTKLLRKIDNAMSLIVRINSSLFTGDAEIEQLKVVTEILAKRAIRLSTLKVAHHGSKNNHFEEIYKELRPVVSLLKSSSKVHRWNYSSAYNTILSCLNAYGIPYCGSLHQYPDPSALGYKIIVEDAPLISIFPDSWTVTEPRVMGKGIVTVGTELEELCSGRINIIDLAI